MTEIKDVDTLACEPGSPTSAMDSPDREEAKETSAADDDASSGGSPGPNDDQGLNDDRGSAGSDASSLTHNKHDADDAVSSSACGDLWLY